MQLIIRNGQEEKTVEMPPEILEAIWSGKAELVPEYIGWDTRWGVLSRSPNKLDVMRENPEKRATQCAGKLSVTLISEDIFASEETLNDAFMPYMTRTEREAANLCK